MIAVCYRHKESQERLTKLAMIHVDVEKMKDDVVQQITSCPLKDALSDGVQKSPDLLRQILVKLEGFIIQAKTASATEASIQEAAELRGKASNVKDFVAAQIGGLLRLLTSYLLYVRGSKIFRHTFFMGY